MTYDIKAEVAIEIISICIAIAKKENDNEKIIKFTKQKEKIYLGDARMIDKVINEYGKYIKKRMV